MLAMLHLLNHLFHLRTSFYRADKASITCGNRASCFVRQFPILLASVVIACDLTDADGHFRVLTCRMHDDQIDSFSRKYFCEDQDQQLHSGCPNFSRTKSHASVTPMNLPSVVRTRQ